MTTTQETKTTQTSEPEKDSKLGKDSKPTQGKKKPDGSKSVASAKTLAGYAAVFQYWVPVPVEDGPVEIDPAKLLVVFDVRTTVQPIDDFVKLCQGGINTPPKITKMRYLGPDGEAPVSPDPKVRVALKHGAEYFVLTYGRRRTRASLKLGFKLIKAELKSYKTWQAMVHDAFLENDARTDMTTWDRASHVKNLRDGGLLQDQIAEELRMSTGSVSQYLGVFELPEPVQKMIGNNELSVTAVRILRPLKDYPADDVIALAQRAVAKGWTEDELKEAVAAFTSRREPDGDGTSKRGKTKKVSRVVDYDKAEVTFVGVSKIRPALNFYATRVKMLRAKEVAEDPQAQIRHARKLAKEEGILEGLLQATKIHEIPAAAFVVEEEAEAE
jgi:ParB/RepB/Spo0J family partition protein